jgi:FkbM family methyltransferase
MRLQPRLSAYGSTSLFMKRIDYEPELSFIRRYAFPGATVLDIGANFGAYTLVLADVVGGEGRVHAFEPGGEALAQLRYNVEVLNPTLQVSVWPFALSDRSGQVSLYHVGGALTTFSLGGEDGDGSELVETLTLDSWFESNPSFAVDLIKIDIEGHELRALQGGVHMLARFRPTVMFEVSTPAMARSGVAGNEIFSFFTELGYEVFALDRGSLRKLAGVIDGNLFAIHRDRS